MWERFSYYGMRALLLLYMTAPLSAGGLGFDAAQGGAIYGLYTSMVYMACLPGTGHGARERSHDAVEDGVLRFGPRPHPITRTISRISGLPGQHKEGSQTQMGHLQ